MYREGERERETLADSRKASVHNSEKKMST